MKKADDLKKELTPIKSGLAPEQYNVCFLKGAEISYCLILKQKLSLS